MSDFDKFFGSDPSAPSHPKLRFWGPLIASNPNSKCEILRKREGFSFQPAEIYLHVIAEDGKLIQTDDAGWDEDINSYLLEHGIQAITPQNEAVRFNLILRADLQKIEVRCGEGYFNAVLLEVIEQEFASVEALNKIVQKIGPGNPHHGRSYISAREGVEGALSGCARLLVQKLKYQRDIAEAVLGNTLALYLDERFAVSPGELLRLGAAVSQTKAAQSQPSLIGKPPKKVIIFDTNAYRNLTYGLSLSEARAKAVFLREKESASENAVLAHPIVIWELLTHLCDSEDPAYDACLAAMVALGEHASSRKKLDGSINLMSDALSTACRELFGRLPAGYEQGLQNLGSLVTHIVKYAPDLSDSVAQANIQNLGRGMIAKEQSWLKGMGCVVDQFAPGAAKVVFGEATDNEALRKVREYFETPEFFAAWSHYIVASNAVEVGITSIPPEDFQAKAELVRKLFATPFHLMRVLLQKLATPQSVNLASPKKKRWNFVWDSMIAFSIGPGTIEGASVCLVTGDKEIVDAASSAGFEKQITSLDAYLKTIGIEE